MKWKQIIGAVAPTVATALGGPVGGLVASMAAKALMGRDSAAPDEVADFVLANQTPETFAKLKELEGEVSVKLRELDVDLARIAAGDRDSARRRQIETGDKMPAVIAIAALGGFFGILGALIFVDVPADALSPLNIMLGALGTLLTSIGAYYFGSSRGSAEKTWLLAGRD